MTVRLAADQVLSKIEDLDSLPRAAQAPDAADPATACRLRGWLHEHDVLEGGETLGWDVERRRGERGDELRNGLGMGRGIEREAPFGGVQRAANGGTPEVDGQVRADLVDQERGAVRVDPRVREEGERLETTPEIELPVSRGRWPVSAARRVDLPRPLGPPITAIERRATTAAQRRAALHSSTVPSPSKSMRSGGDDAVQRGPHQ